MENENGRGDAQAGRGKTIRIAMWSGPRNISTAMMRAFENRADTSVWDEPFYAAYLQATGLDHPMRAEVIASGETDWRRVADAVLGPVPGGKSVFYQKHMTHHMLPGIGLDWIDALTNCFLIRTPERVLASYTRKRVDVTLADIGFELQEVLFDRVAQRTGIAPPVIDSDDVLRDPRGRLTDLCQVCGIAFDEAMLAWPAGRRDSDGVWAAHWYNAVEASTGFSAPVDADVPSLPDDLRRISDAARPIYDRLAAHRTQNTSKVGG